MSRRQAAALLGFASEFKVRQLEREGRLTAVRGAMSSAWYPAGQVRALAQRLAAEDPDAVGHKTQPLEAPDEGPGAVSDARLIAFLREPVVGAANDPGSAPEPWRLAGPVDLVAELGVSIRRAEQVYRFWLLNDDHPAAGAARAARDVDRGSTAGPPRRGRPRSAGVDALPAAVIRSPARDAHVTTARIAPTPPTPGPTAPSPAADPAPALGKAAMSASSERRGPSRLARDQLIQQLRDADPRRRAEAFAALKQFRR